MKTIPLPVVSLFIVTTFTATINAVDISTLPQLVDDGDCCKLELENLIDEGSRKFIPSSAIPALTRNGVETYFFITKVPFDLAYAPVGTINNTAKGYGYNWAPADKRHKHWTKGAILSNPNQCRVNWHESKLPLADTNKLSHPKLSSWGGKIYFGRANYWYSYGYYTGGTHYLGTYLNGINMETGRLLAINYSYELLYVDCFTSLREQLLSELYHIHLDHPLTEGEKEEEETVSSTELTNDSDEDQMMKIDLDAEISSSLMMTHESKLHEFSRTKWAAHGSADLARLSKLLSLTTNQNYPNLKDFFTRTGSVSLESRKTVYRLNQEIKVNAGTKTQVFIKTRPIKGDTQFTAYYKLEPTTSSKMWTHERIIASMRRIGFEEWDKLKSENGSLIMPVRGQLAIETAFETVAEVVSTPLNSTSPAKVERSPLKPAH